MTQNLEISARAAEAFSRLGAEKPLIHHITSLVAINNVANVTLNVGALPVMAEAMESRGFGRSGRTFMRDYRMKAMDWLVMAVAVAALVVIGLMHKA